jgi:hypothetical protein
MGMIDTPSNLRSIRYEWATETQSHLRLAEHGALDAVGLLKQAEDSAMKPTDERLTHCATRRSSVGFTAGFAAARRRVERLCGSVTLWQERVCTLRIW